MGPGCPGNLCLSSSLGSGWRLDVASWPSWNTLLSSVMHRFMRRPRIGAGYDARIRCAPSAFSLSEPGLTSLGGVKEILEEPKICLRFSKWCWFILELKDTPPASYICSWNVHISAEKHKLIECSVSGEGQHWSSGSRYGTANLNSTMPMLEEPALWMLVQENPQKAFDVLILERKSVFPALAALEWKQLDTKPESHGARWAWRTEHRCSVCMWTISGLREGTEWGQKWINSDFFRDQNTKTPHLGVFVLDLFSEENWCFSFAQESASYNRESCGRKLLILLFCHLLLYGQEGFPSVGHVSAHPVPSLTECVARCFMKLL